MTGPAEPSGRDGPEDLDPGLARERTSLAWTRTAISFAAVGGVVLKNDVVAGLVILATTPVIWRLGYLARDRRGQAQAGHRDDRRRRPGRPRDRPRQLAERSSAPQQPPSSTAMADARGRFAQTRHSVA